MPYDIEINKTGLFNNLRANILFQGAVVVEDIAVRNIWKKHGASFFDIYIHRTNQYRMIDSVYVKNILNLNTGEPYGDTDKFIDFFLEKQKELTPAQKSNQEKLAIFRSEEHLEKILEPIKDDITILVFIAQHDSILNKVKLRIMTDYIKSRTPEARAFTQDLINDYLRYLLPTEDEYYDAVNNLNKKDVADAQELLEEALKVSVSDGTLSYLERYYIAELIQYLRDHDVKLNIDL